MNQDKLQALISSNEQTDAIVSQTIKLLLNCVRCSDEKVTILAGACPGQIGAVDPGRLRLLEDLKRGGNQTTHLSVLHENFTIGRVSLIWSKL